MPKSTRQRMMHLGAFVHETGQHVAAWRHPKAHSKSGVSFAEMAETAMLAERGKFDLLFLADSAAVNLSDNVEARGRMGKIVKFEPMTILCALAAVTKNLGLVATSTTTFNEPIRWPASSRRSTRSAAAAPAGTSSPPTMSRMR